MRTYVGWVPTTVGRLSFGSIGDSYRSSSVIFNAGSASPRRKIFGVSRSRTSWLPGFLSRWWRRYPTTAFAIFFSIAPAQIAVPAEGKPCSHSLVTEPDGSLRGRIYFLNGWGFTRGRTPRTLLRGVRFSALLAEENLDLPEVGDKLWSSWRDRVDDCWKQELQAVKPTEKFNDLMVGFADVELLRSGECRISLSPENHSLLRWVREIGDEDFWGPEYLDEIDQDTLKHCAEGIFGVVRNLAHKHYHHSGDAPPSWALTEQGENDDRRWRNATMHSLLRSVIALRRSDSAHTFRQALGILAYADAFQRHLGTWSNQRGQAVKIKDRMVYDFAALKASIEASLKVRELKDQSVRARIIFGFGTLLTALTLIAPILRDYLPEVPEGANALPSQDVVLGPLAWMGANPIPSLICAALIGFGFDALVTRLALNRDISNFAARSAQIMDVTLAVASDRFRLGSRVTQVLVIIMLLFGLIGVLLAWLAVFLGAGFPIDELLRPYRWLPTLNQ